MNNEKNLMETISSWGFAVNARIAFDKFTRLIETEKGIIDEVRKIFV